jgi:hypothetical protein
MQHLKKYISITAVALVAVAAAVFVSVGLPEKQPENPNQDPLADLFSASQNQLESNFIKSNMVQFSGTWPHTCDPQLPDIDYKPKTVFASFDIDAAETYMTSHTTKDIVAALGGVFGKAINENSINWRWSNSQKKYTFTTFPGDEENWACYFTKVDFFKDVFTGVTLDYMLLGDVTKLSGKFKKFSDPLQEAMSGNTAEIRWKSVKYANEYEISYGTSEDNLDQTGTSTKTSFSLPELEAGSVYYLGIKAKDTKAKYTSSQNFAEILKIDIDAGVVGKVGEETATVVCDISQKTCSGCNVGDKCGGGKIAWLKGGSGLIVSLEEGEKTEWANAKEHCESKSDDFSDWYLPTKPELYSVFENKYKLGKFKNTLWSSTEFGTKKMSATVVDFDVDFDVDSDADDVYSAAVGSDLKTTKQNFRCARKL